MTTSDPEPSDTRQVIRRFVVVALLMGTVFAVVTPAFTG